MRLIVVCNGTRGDFQPYLSLAVRLREKGHEVKFYTSESHAKMAAEFGFPFIVTSGDMEELLRGPACKEAMEKGDFAVCAPAMETITTPELVEKSTQEVTQDLKSFKPDLAVVNSIGRMAVFMVFAKEAPYLPQISVELQPQCMASNDYKSTGFQRQLPDEDTPNIMTFLWLCQNGVDVEAVKEYYAKNDKEACLKAMDFQCTPEHLFELTFDPDLWLTPRFMAYSPAFWPNPADWPESDNVKVVGNFKLSKATQDEYTKKGSKYFSVGADYEKCQEFIAKVGPPVYVGWGSMLVYTKQHMTLLAVQALKRAGEKGIILGGWAQIGEDGLDGAEGEEELKAWCKENVLFIKAAPHELLFPQCKAAVHHGGIGTLQASLSGGCPTIITPVFADQFDNAAHLQKIKCGTFTKRLGKLKQKELGDAIKTVCDDPTYKANAVAVSEAMLKEDGIGECMSWLEKFHTEKVLTGKYIEERKAEKERHYALRVKNVKMDSSRLNAKFQAVLQSRYPPVKEWVAKNQMTMAISADLVNQGKLWISMFSVVAREGQGLQTPELGRIMKWAWLEELGRDQKGNRIHVKKLSGRGPAEGWVSVSVKGKDMMIQPKHPMELSAIKGQEYAALFADIQGGKAAADKED